MFDAEFFPAATTVIKLTDYQLHAGSDMNVCVNNNLDKSSSTIASSQDAVSKALHLLMTDLNLTDLSAKDFTFFCQT